MDLGERGPSESVGGQSYIEEGVKEIGKLHNLFYLLMRKQKKITIH